MKLKSTLLYVMFAGALALSGCYKEVDCTNSSANVPPPVPEVHFRIINADGQDMLAESTPNNLSFDSLTAKQPCNANDALGKRKTQTGAGGLESYVFYFTNMYQPITGENNECFTLLLQWSETDVDVVRFNSRAEHHDCGVTYYLDGVTFNGQDVATDDNGNYILRR